MAATVTIREREAELSAWPAAAPATRSPAGVIGRSEAQRLTRLALLAADVIVWLHAAVALGSAA